MHVNSISQVQKEHGTMNKLYKHPGHYANTQQAHLIWHTLVSMLKSSYGFKTWFSYFLVNQNILSVRYV